MVFKKKLFTLDKTIQNKGNQISESKKKYYKTNVLKI